MDVRIRDRHRTCGRTGTQSARDLIWIRVRIVELEVLDRVVVEVLVCLGHLRGRRLVGGLGDHDVVRRDPTLYGVRLLLRELEVFGVVALAALWIGHGESIADLPRAYKTRTG
jgi:hypothetical protein